jgi:hypothetical protein
MGRETRNALGCINTSTVWNRITRKNIGTYRYGLSRIEPEPGFQETLSWEFSRILLFLFSILIEDRILVTHLVL